ncbi:MAG: FAD-dependent thymidylate synthase, partial [Deltaproteobacteria bacterium]|nr:FAD-dependent thymidylate synthase [Deltaproteobacteria bacterium]
MASKLSFRPMKVILAGYNLDSDAIREMRAKEPERGDATPETISAAYARISRDPRPVNELREAARKEVDKARKSNRTIIFEMGHHSVAEHAVFNFDLMGISRLAIEAVEKFRLCSFTEKSQRYIKLGEDFVVPAEIRNAGLEVKFREAVKTLFSCYERIFGALLDKGMKEAGAEDKAREKEVVNAAKEDARYITPLATTGQLGLTVNARNLELMFRRFASHPLDEVRELGRKMYEEVRAIAPSIVIFTEANDYDRLAYNELSENLREQHFSTSALQFLSSSAIQFGEANQVTLIDCTKDADEKILASLAHSVGVVPYKDALKWIKEKSGDKKLGILKAVSRHIQFYDVMPREFEHARLTFEIV